MNLRRQCHIRCYWLRSTSLLMSLALAWARVQKGKLAGVSSASVTGG